MRKTDMTTPSSFEAVGLLDEFCRKSLINAHFNQWRGVCFAVHEAIINSVEATKKLYNDESINRDISVKILADENQVEIHIIDDAGGIPSECFHKSDGVQLENLLLNECGRGLLLIMTLVDKVWQEYDGKYVLKLYKRLEEKTNE